MPQPLACTPYLPGNYEDDILSVLTQWVSDYTGVTTIRSHENGPRPPGQYVTLFVQSIQDFDDGIAIHNFFDDPASPPDVCEEIIETQRVDVDINCYRDHGDVTAGQEIIAQGVQPPRNRSAIDVLTSLKRIANLDSAQQKLYNNCMAIQRFGPVLNLRDLIKNDYESRAFTRLSLIAEMNESNRLPSVCKVEFTTCEESNFTLPINVDCEIVPPAGCT